MTVPITLEYIEQKKQEFTVLATRDAASKFLQAVTTAYCKGLITGPQMREHAQHVRSFIDFAEGSVH